jgi:COMPASS component SWD3
VRGRDERPQGCAQQWQGRQRRCPQCLVTHPADPDYNPAGKYYLQATLDSRLRLVAVETGRCVKTYSGHRNEDFCCGATFVAGLPAAGGGPEPMDTDSCVDTKAGAADGSGSGRVAVASGSEDGSLCVWDLNSRKVLQRELGSAAGGAGHSAAALCIAAHPAAPLVVTGGQEPDCSIKVWRA